MLSSTVPRPYKDHPYKDHLFKHESGPYKDEGLYTFLYIQMEPQNWCSRNRRNSLGTDAERLKLSIYYDVSIIF